MFSMQCVVFEIKCVHGDNLNNIKNKINPFIRLELVVGIAVPGCKAGLWCRMLPVPGR